MRVHIGNIDDHRSAILVHLLFDRQRTEVLSLVVGNLLPIHRKALGKVTIAIEDADSTHIDVGVGCFLHVVASQHAKTAAVNLQGRMDAILHAEICD